MHFAQSTVSPFTLPTLDCSMNADMPDIEPLALSQVEECRALQYQCECREAAIVQNGSFILEKVSDPNNEQRSPYKVLYSHFMVPTSTYILIGMAG
jgi:hypothetical protein